MGNIKRSVESERKLRRNGLCNEESGSGTPLGVNFYNLKTTYLPNFQNAVK